MKIGWIGGLDRNESILERMAERAGHTLEFHKGDTGGRGAEALRRLVERSDFVILVTEINSHGGMLLGKKLCQKLGRGSMVIRTLGLSRFQALLEALTIREGRAFLATG